MGCGQRRWGDKDVTDCDEKLNKHVRGKVDEDEEVAGSVYVCVKKPKRQLELNIEWMRGQQYRQRNGRHAIEHDRFRAWQIFEFL